MHQPLWSRGGDMAPPSQWYSAPSSAYSSAYGSAYASPVSSRTSSTSGSGSMGSPRGDLGCGAGGMGPDTLADDVFGLQGLQTDYYAPQLEEEFERLLRSPKKQYSGGAPGASPAYLPMGAGNAPSYFPGRACGSPPYPSVLRRVDRPPSVWDEFCNNGGESQPLDDLDRHLRGMSVSIPLAEPGHAPYSPKPQGSGGPCSPLMLLGGAASPANRAADAANMAAVKDIITKAHLIDILRQREQQQRATRGAIKRVIVPTGAIVTSGGVAMSSGGKGSLKSATGKVCVFCRNNGEAESVYASHQLKDPEGAVTCPVLYIYTCPICGAHGSDAHTIKYCPFASGDTLSMKTLTKTARTAAGLRTFPRIPAEHGGVMGGGVAYGMEGEGRRMFFRV